MAAAFATWRCVWEENDAFQHPAEAVRVGTTHAFSRNIVPTTTSERNRTQTICASLIASSIVTAGCADEACLRASSIDAESNSGAQSPEMPLRRAAELPLEGKVIFRLQPVVSSLPVQSDIAIPSLLTETVAQPRPTPVARTAPSITSGEIQSSTNASELAIVPQVLQLRGEKAPGLVMSKRPLLQDAYVAFGVNGR